MARGADIEIPIAVDTGNVAKQINNGLVDPLEDAHAALEKLGKEDAGKDLAKDLDKAQDATQKLDTELDQARKGLNKLGFAGKDAGRDVKAGLDEAKDEAKQSGREAAASFSGEFDDVADFVQETIANAFGGFGPAGAAAGIAVAAVIGTVLSNAQQAQEKLADTREAAADLASQLYESGGVLPMTERVDELFQLLSKERRARNPFETIADGFVDLGTNIDVAKDAAKAANIPLKSLIDALSGADLDDTYDALNAINEELAQMGEESGNVNWDDWAARHDALEGMKTELEAVITKADLADELVSAVGSSYDSAPYIEKVEAIGQAWENAMVDASDYFEKTEEGTTTFNADAYLADAEAALAAANEYKRKLVTLPPDIAAEAERLFAEQGAEAALAYTNAYLGATAADKGRYEEAARQNGDAAGKAQGEAQAEAAEAAAKAKAQGWGALTMPVKYTVDDSAVRNWTPPVKISGVRYLPQAV